MNEHLEYWKRFARAYMRWVNFSFDRIVTDAVKRHTAVTPADGGKP